MKHVLLAFSIVVGAWALGPTSDAEARGWRSWNHGKRHDVRRYQWRRQRLRDQKKVPELDPNAAGSAMVLLLGGAAYVLSRRRKDDELAY